VAQTLRQAGLATLLICRGRFDSHAIDFGNTPGDDGQQQRGYEHDEHGPPERALSNFVFGDVVRHKAPWAFGQRHQSMRTCCPTSTSNDPKGSGRREVDG